MMKTVKKITFIAAILFLAAGVLSSCLDDNNKRTWEMEQAEIQSFLEGLISEGHDIDTTELGVYYVTINEGEGVFPKQGDTLTIGYAGYFIDGTLFDSTELSGSDSTYTYQFIDEPMIPGFEDGMKLMNKGAKIEMIIPSDLAYGATGASIIPSYATLVFVVRLVDIKPLVESE